MTGIIKMISQDKGFGFIRAAGSDFFFHYRSMLSPGDFAELEEGARVEFQVEQSGKGPRACAVNRLIS